MPRGISEISAREAKDLVGAPRRDSKASSRTSQRSLVRAAKTVLTVGGLMHQHNTPTLHSN